MLIQDIKNFFSIKCKLLDVSEEVYLKYKDVNQTYRQFRLSISKKFFAGIQYKDGNFIHAHFNNDLIYVYDYILYKIERTSITNPKFKKSVLTQYNRKYRISTTQFKQLIKRDIKTIKDTIKKAIKDKIDKSRICDLLFLDLEFDASSNEILQIGIIHTDKKLKIKNEIDYYIKPDNDMFEVVDNHRKKKIALQKGVYFEDIIKTITPIIQQSKKYSFVTFGGDTDISLLKLYCNKYNVNNINFDNNIDVYKLTKCKCDLKTLVKKFNISSTKTFHNALNDAYYTYEVYKQIKSAILIQCFNFLKDAITTKYNLCKI